MTRSLSYLNDEAGNRLRLTYPDNQYVTYNYDGLNRPLTILRSGSATIASYGYDAAGRRNAFNGGVNTAYGYDGIGRLAVLANNPAANAAYNNSYGFGYNPAGQITQLTKSNNAFVFDRHYNVNRTYAVNGLNQYSSAGSASFQYDANGNLTSDGSSTFVYDVENRLVSASGAKSGTLRYDPLGHLYETSGGISGTTRYLYDDDALAAEYDGGGTLLRRYVHGADSAADDPIAWYEGAGFAASNERILRSDWQGSVVLVTDSSGATIHAVNRYDEYGIPQPGNAGRFQYTGQAWMRDLGMYYYKARIYSPTLGRFLQTDPIGYDDQINLYAYVANDPVNKTDPTGMESPCVTLNTGCGMGGFSLPSLDTVINVATVVLVGIDILDGPTPDVGAAAVAARAARAERMAANAAQGAKAEAQTAARLGDRVAGRRVTLESSTGRRSTTDFVTKEKGVVETKSGGARLSPGQRDVKADIDAGRPVTPRGQNAENAGLKPGEPTRMKCYEVDRCK